MEMKLTLTLQNQKRKKQLVDEYAQKHNWQAITRLIGGKPREDLQDYIPGQDDGEPPTGAKWD